MCKHPQAELGCILEVCVRTKAAACLNGGHIDGIVNYGKDTSPFSSSVIVPVLRSIFSSLQCHSDLPINILFLMMQLSFWIESKTALVKGKQNYFCLSLFKCYTMKAGTLWFFPCLLFCQGSGRCSSLLQSFNYRFSCHIPKYPSVPLHVFWRLHLGWMSCFSFWIPWFGLRAGER